MDRIACPWLIKKFVDPNAEFLFVPVDKVMQVAQEQGATPFDAACAGAYLVGSAGELAASLRSWGATATDVLEAIPAILLRMQSDGME